MGEGERVRRGSEGEGEGGRVCMYVYMCVYMYACICMRVCMFGVWEGGFR